MSGINQILFIFIGIPIIALIIAIAKLMMESTGWIEFKPLSSSDQLPVTPDLAYYPNKRREEQEGR